MKTKHRVFFGFAILALAFALAGCRNPTAAVGVSGDAATPVLSVQPVDATYGDGDTAWSLFVIASVTDGGTLSYRWYSNTVNSTDGGTPANGNGATTATYMPDITENGIVYYYVVVTNTNNIMAGEKIRTAVSSVAKVEKIAGSVTHAEEPTINTHPQGDSYTVGTPATSLSVTATIADGGTLSYRWYRNTVASTSGGTSISGATGDTYTPPTTAAGTVYYYVIVTNTNDSVNGTQVRTATSNVAAIVVSGNLTGSWIGNINGSPVTLTFDSSSWWATGPGGPSENGYYTMSGNTASLYNTNLGAGYIGTTTLTGADTMTLLLIGGVYPGTYYFTRLSFSGGTQYTVTFSAGEGGGTPPTSMTVEEGTTITLPGQGNMTAPAGKTFRGWDYGSYSEGESVTIFYDRIFTASWENMKYPNAGIYISLISFAGNATILNNPYASPYYDDFTLLDYNGKSNLSYMLNNNYSIASASGTALFYAVHKGLANMTANAGEFPADISSVNMITFTDGLDNGSFLASNTNPIENKSGVTSTEYATYVHDQIGSRKINGKPITAYSVGVKGADVEDETQFDLNLGNIASAPANVTKITDFSDLDATFAQIADSLTFATHFSMTTTGNDPGTIVRMTFDVTGTTSADAAASLKYIEGTLAYSGGVYTLTNVTYGSGISSDTLSGGAITGTIYGANVSFLFRNIEGYDPATATVQQWTKSSAGATTWQRNSEYNASGSTSTSTVLIQLVLDASTSLDSGQITQIRTAVNQFINKLYERVTGGGY
jgi:hypothetical protein